MSTEATPFKQPSGATLARRRRIAHLGLPRGGLVLSRSVGEQVFIGGDVTITVIDIHGDKVRLQFHAPRSIPIQRSELAREKDLSVPN